MPNDLGQSEPYAWWGPVWTPAAPRNLGDLLRDRVLTPEMAALLWALMSRHASVIVIAEPRGAGKTTLLTALLDLYPPALRRIYLRGCYDPLTVLDHPALDPHRTLLLVNEISDHLPIYLWGSGVGRLFAATRRGFTFAATAHASDATALAHDLTAPPLALHPNEVGAIDLVVALDLWRERETPRRAVRQVTTWNRARRGDLREVPLATTDRATGQTRLNPSPIIQFVAERGERLTAANLAAELQARTAVLAEICKHGPPQTADLRAAIGRKWVRAGQIR
ncbi:MAG: type II secretion system protein E [Chloroflexia bacterium]|nr:type II secretion system protein E [Chloroflexia bacterium]